MPPGWLFGILFALVLAILLLVFLWRQGSRRPINGTIPRSDRGLDRRVINRDITNRSGRMTTNPTPPSNNRVCTSDQACGYGEQCQDGTCVSIACRKQSDCGGSLTCIDGLCQPRRCLDPSQCDSGEACIGSTGPQNPGICIPTMRPCDPNAPGQQCFGGRLNCRNGSCVQCQSAQDCPTGQVCQEGVCRRPQTARECGPDEVLTDGRCCPNDGICGQGCDQSSDCGGSCPFCVNGVCRCTPGRPSADPSTVQLGDTCSTGRDCATGNCLGVTPGQNPGLKYCVQTGGSCLFNHDPTDPNQPLSCSSGQPFCVQGRCQRSARGSACQSNSDCPRSEGQNQFCVNHVCQPRPGRYGEICYDDRSCEDGLTCQNRGRLNVCVPRDSDQRPLIVITPEQAASLNDPNLRRRVETMRRNNNVDVLRLSG